MADQTLTQDQAQAEWDAMAAQRGGDDTAQVKEVAPETPPQETTEAAPQPVAEQVEEAQVDPYAGLSPEVRAKLERFDQMAGSQQQLLNELRETKGRVSALQSEFAKSRHTQNAGDSPSQKQIAAAASNPQKWAELKNDFPEWGEGIEAFVESRLGALAGSGLTAEQVEQQVAQRTDMLAQQFEKSLVELKYDNWENIVRTDEFGQWFGAQKPEVQMLAHSPKGKDALRMLDLFHEAKKKPVADVRQTRQEKLAAAVTAKPGAPVATKTFEDMTPTEQWNYLAEERARKSRAEA